jgi:16S rRNA (cytosine1402-N4)-methyltransferase
MPQHIPVLAGPALEWLRVKPDGVYADCTAGAGGHSALIASRLKTGRLIALDCDPDAVARVRERLREYPQAKVIHANYGRLAEVLQAEGIAALDGTLIDAGVSSIQLDDPARGLSFQQRGPLDMRLDMSAGRDAGRFLRETPEEELAEVLRAYGDVRPARRIARAIARRAAAGSLETTTDLVAAVQEALNLPGKTPEEVRTVFQAVRMAVNDELAMLEAGLRQGLAALAPGGRLVAISFHSGEDRVVKRVFASASKRQVERHADGRTKRAIEPEYRMLTSKPVVADTEEVRQNPRSKSAKLRVIERKTPGE